MDKCTIGFVLMCVPLLAVLVALGWAVWWIIKEREWGIALVFLGVFAFVACGVVGTYLADTGCP